MCDRLEYFERDVLREINEIREQDGKYKIDGIVSTQIRGLMNAVKSELQSIYNDIERLEDIS